MGGAGAGGFEAREEVWGVGLEADDRVVGGVARVDCELFVIRFGRGVEVKV
jgi:hypothetical protein